MSTDKPKINVKPKPAVGHESAPSFPDAAEREAVRRQTGETEEPAAPLVKLPKVGEEVTIVKLNKLYDKYAERVLAGKLSRTPREKKGAVRRFNVTAELPQPDEYRKLKQEKYSTTVGSLVEDAYQVIEDMASEVRDWHGNLPESFQDSDKGNALDEAASTLENQSAPDVPDCVADVKVIFYPSLDAESRQARVQEAGSMLRAAIDALADAEGKADCEECDGSGKIDCDKCGTEDADCPECEGEGKVDSDDLSEFTSALESAADEVEGVEIPGMYG